MDAYNRAIKLLAIREHTEKELERKLIDKGYTQEESMEAVSKLSSEGFVSDRRFAESYIHSRLLRNPEGRAILLARLKEKGCNSEEAEIAIKEAWESKEWLIPLESAIKKRIGKKTLDDTIIFYRKKAFSLSEIKEALNNLKIEEISIEDFD